NSEYFLNIIKQQQEGERTEIVSIANSLIKKSDRELYLSNKISLIEALVKLKPTERHEIIVQSEPLFQIMQYEILHHVLTFVTSFPKEKDQRNKAIQQTVKILQKSPLNLYHQRCKLSQILYYHEILSTVLLSPCESMIEFIDLLIDKKPDQF